jgi:hypothetical protein
MSPKIYQFCFFVRQSASHKPKNACEAGAVKMLSTVAASFMCINCLFRQNSIASADCYAVKFLASNMRLTRSDCIESRVDVVWLSMANFAASKRKRLRAGGVGSAVGMSLINSIVASSLIRNACLHLSVLRTSCI